jgi:hypothetical protein
MSAFMRGYDAASDWLLLNANPFPEGNAYWEWQRGWRAYWDHRRHPMFGWRNFEI